MLQQREHQELRKEGKNIPQEEKKRNIRRDQFEPSSDNPHYKQPISNQQPLVDQKAPESQKPSDGFNRNELFSNEISNGPKGGFELPINNRREDLFGPGI